MGDIKDLHYLDDDTKADQDINYFEDEYIHSKVSDVDSIIKNLKTCVNEKIRSSIPFKSSIDDYDDIYDELKTTPSGKLLKNVVSSEGVGDHHIVIFDNWIECLIGNNIYSKKLTFPNGNSIHFNKLYIKEPSYDRGTESIPLTPQMAREQGVTYGIDLYLDMEMRDEKGNNILEKGEINPKYIKKGIHICNIPLMLKSKYCVLRGKTKLELAMYGEDPNDPGGYFIVEGNEKIVLGQEQLITDKILLTNTNNYVSSKLTANTNGGTVVMEVYENASNSNVLEIFLQKMKSKSDDPKSLNVLRIFRLFAEWEQQRLASIDEDIDSTELSQLNRTDKIVEYISHFIKDDPNIKKKSLLKLNRTIMDFNLIPDDRQVISKNMSRDANNPVTDDEIRDIFRSNLYPHLHKLPPINGENETEYQLRIIMSKLNLLSIQTARMLEYNAGFRSLDDRDSWSNKRVEGAGRLMETLFRLSWKKTLEIAQGNIVTKNYQGSSHDLDIIAGNISQSTIVTCTFRDSFITGKWGMKGTNLKEAVAQPLSRDGVISTLANINTVDVSISRTDRQTILRLVQMSQFGFISAFYTPEGKGCGLLKNFCLATKLTVGRDDTNIIQHLMGDEEMDQDRLVALTYEESEDMGYNDKIIVGGKFIGWCDGESLTEDLVSRRRSGEFYYDMSVIRDQDYIYVDVSPSRVIRPLLLVNPKSQEENHSADEPFLMIDVKKLREASNQELLSEGCMEYISPWEQEFIKLAVTEDRNDARWNAIKTAIEALYQEMTLQLEAKLSESKVAVSKNGDIVELKEAQNRVKQALEIYNKANNTKVFTHCEIDPLILLDVSASLIPWPNHNQAPRNTYQVSMGKQALGNYHSNHLNRMNDGATKTLAFPQRPIVETDMYSVFGLDNKGPGENVIQQFLSVPYTEEDAFVIKKEFLDNGGMRMYKYITYKIILNKSNADWDEVLEKPKLEGEYAKFAAKYRYMSDNGLPMIGAPVKEGDYIIGKIQKPKETRDNRDAGNRDQRNESVVVRIGDEGVIQKVSRSSNNGREIIIVKIRIMRVPQEGDKYAPRNAQKGTGGLVLSDVDLQYGSSGISADYTANSASMPSRMTMAYPQEVHSGKAAAMMGTHINAGAHHPYERDRYREALKRYGLHEFAYEEMRSGTSGDYLEALVSCGIVFFQALRHHVRDKIQARGIGTVNPQTRQALRGRTNHGGLRFGEMERDVAIAYGASAFLRERLMGVSDEYHTVFCIICGFFAINDPHTNSYRKCPLCGNEDKFGKCSIPYVYKLLIHLLAAPGIHLRPELITNTDYALKVLPKGKSINIRDDGNEEYDDEKYLEDNQDNDEAEEAELQLEEEAADDEALEEYGETGDYFGDDVDAI
jgi:DNA-directed RNA polymerase II subunit RPB2